MAASAFVIVCYGSKHIAHTRYIRSVSGILVMEELCYSHFLCTNNAEIAGFFLMMFAMAARPQESCAIYTLVVSLWVKWLTKAVRTTIPWT